MYRGCARKISVWLSKLHFIFQRKLSRKNFFLCKSYNLLLSFENRAEKFRLTVVKKSAVFWNCILPLQGNLFKKIFFEKCLHQLWTVFRIISGKWAGKVWPAYQNCILRIYRKVLLEKVRVLESKWIFPPFWDSKQEIFEPVVECFDGDVGIAFYVSMVTF